MAAKKVVKAVESVRTYVSQSDVPGVSLEQALRIPRSIAEHYAFRPTSPLRVASALGVSPSAGPFKTLCGASIAYGMTSGGYNAQEITLSDLGRRIVKPVEEGDDVAARRQALLTPRVVGEFLRRYDGAKVPRIDIAKNVLHDLGVPVDRAERVLELILEGAKDVGFLHDIKGSVYVELLAPNESVDDQEQPERTRSIEVDGQALARPRDAVSDRPAQEPESMRSNRRVFITHGKNRSLLELLKKLLGFGEMESVISAERESVSQPVPDKVMADMRSCGAAIIHVDDEQRVMDKTGTEQVILNPNVLIEIGAAMALYGRRFILLVKDGTKLPSNLQGLYEVRYVGDALDGDATVKLMSAINDIKNHPLPSLGANP